MKSWKTTLFGVLAAVGTALSASHDPVIHSFGLVFSSIGSLFLGFTAQDILK